VSFLDALSANPSRGGGGERINSIFKLRNLWCRRCRFTH